MSLAFLNTMNSMRKHYRPDGHVLAAPFSFAPLSAPWLPSTFLRDPAPSEVPGLCEVLADVRDNAMKIAEQQQHEIMRAKDALLVSKDRSGFIRIMNEQRAAAQATAERQINDIFNKALNIGKDKGPLMQNLVMQSMNKAMEAVKRAVSMIEDFIDSVVGKITDFIANCAQKIEDTFIGVFYMISCIL